MFSNRSFIPLLTNRNLKALGIPTPERALVRSESATTGRWLELAGALPKRDTQEDRILCIRAALQSELSVLARLLPANADRELSSRVALSVVERAAEAEEFGLAVRIASLIEETSIGRANSELIDNVKRCSRMRADHLCLRGHEHFDAGEVALAISIYMIELREWLE